MSALSQGEATRLPWVKRQHLRRQEMRFMCFIVCGLLVHYQHPWPAFCVMTLCWLRDWAHLEATRELLVLEKEAPLAKMLREFSRN